MDKKEQSRRMLITRNLVKKSHLEFGEMNGEGKYFGHMGQIMQGELLFLLEMDLI